MMNINLDELVDYIGNKVVNLCSYERHLCFYNKKIKEIIKIIRKVKIEKNKNQCF